MKAAHKFMSMLGLTTIIVLIITFIKNRDASTTHVRSKVGSRLTFKVDAADLVAMSISDTSRYDLTEDGKADFAALMPTGGHTVYISGDEVSEPRPFTVSLFHQLKCLDIYHREYLKPTPRRVTLELQGCLNYLRQSLLCHANTRLESIKNSAIQAEKQYETVCRDWTKVYDAAEKNYASYLRRKTNI
ncbi:hypothetical protein BDN70DRAFT_832296 [Pholiota conissans]|uniref:Uncharacterized protein n=1 Tax=Pholiota conissans TaxID=109636 RepID=A0A9P5Z4M0_9AGAR|nr:hypothetical protein BDN70DRAFT_832296 [Pholiota conissans]